MTITKTKLQGVVYLKTGKKFNVWLKGPYEVGPRDLTSAFVHMFKLRGWFEPGYVFVQGDSIDCIEQLESSL
jgi:hypothetical protein